MALVAPGTMRIMAGVDSAALAQAVWREDAALGPGRMGTLVACAALERMIGAEGIHDAVDLIMDGGTGYEIAESVLVHIRSAEATRYAYSLYRASTGQRAADAARVIKQIAHPLALQWVEELLAHPTAAGWGMGLLDQLLWSMGSA